MARAETVMAFNRLVSCSLFRIGGTEIDIAKALITLAECVKNEPDDDDSWLYLGEYGDFCCHDLIVAGYWAMADCHGGQASTEYAALSALGDIFQPGMSSQPTSEDDGPEYWPYKAICDHLCPNAKAAD